jgi:hypothetical protein
MGLVNLWILSGIRTLNSKIALSRLENKGISYLNGEVTAIDPVSRTVTIKGSSTHVFNHTPSETATNIPTNIPTIF